MEQGRRKVGSRLSAVITAEIVVLIVVILIALRDIQVGLECFFWKTTGIPNLALRLLKILIKCIALHVAKSSH